MPNPILRSDVHTDAPLTNYVVGYRSVRDLAAMVMEVTTENESDEFYRMEQSFRRVDGIKRPDGAQAQRVDLGLEKDTFSIDEYALYTSFGARLLRQQHLALRLLQRAALELEGLVEIEYEYQIYVLLTTDANWAAGHTVTLTDEWDDYVNGDPLGDFDTAIDDIMTDVGGNLPPGAVIRAALPKGGWYAVKHHPDVKDRVKYTAAPGTPVGPEIVAGLVEIEKLIPSRAALNSSTVTPDTLTDPTGNARLWPDSTDQCVIAVVGTGVGGAPPTEADYSGFASLSTFGLGIRRWQNNQERGNQAGPAEYVEASKFWDLRSIAVDTKASSKCIAGKQVKNILT